jgi:hypothetical protein
VVCLLLCTLSFYSLFLYHQLILLCPANKAYACLNLPASRNAHPFVRLILFKKPWVEGRTSFHLSVRTGALRLSLPPSADPGRLYDELSYFGSVSHLYLDENDMWIAHYISDFQALRAIPKLKDLYRSIDIQKIVSISSPLWKNSHLLTENLQDIYDHPLERLELEIVRRSYFGHFIDFINRWNYLMICALLGLLFMNFLLSRKVPCSTVRLNSSITDTEPLPPSLQSQNLTILGDCQPGTVYSSEKTNLLLREVITREARAVEGEVYEKKKNLEKSVKLREAEEEIVRLKKEALMAASLVWSQKREIEEAHQRRKQYKAAIKANGDFLLDMLN